MTTAFTPDVSHHPHAAARAARFTQFTPATRALVLIDYQVGTLQPVKTMAADLALRNAATSRRRQYCSACPWC